MEQGILGGLSGKIGSVVGSSWKGIPVLKTKPLSVANPQTAGQVAQRTKFSNSVAFAGIILATVIKPLWDRFASRMSGYNEFIQTNIDLFAATLPNPFADLIISKGKMAATVIDALVAVSAAKLVTIQWINDSGSGFKLTTDVAYAVIINETTGEIVGGADGFNRADGETELSFSVNLEAADDIHAYLAFKRADGTVVSNTSYKVGVIA